MRQKRPFFAFTIFALSSIIVPAAMSSTFVGNGGNVGDVELQMTLQQLNQTFSAISENQSGIQEHLCVCTPTYEGRPQCDVLKRLNEAQVRFCSRYISMKSAELAELLRNKDRVRFTWTHQPIEVQEQGRLRAVDAVTNIKDMSMTLNQSSFVSMAPEERAFLFAHELFHFTTYEGAPLTDEGPIGPFQAADGKRQLVNAMAASLVMMTNHLGAFRLSEATLQRSQASQKQWLYLGYQSLAPRYNEENAFAVDRLEGAEFGGRYQFTPNFGAVLEFRNLNGTRNRMTQIEGKENRQIFSAGLAYRWFPQENPLTFWGQSHAVFAVTADRINVNYDLRSARTGLNEKAETTGFTVSAKYFVPLKHGFWGYANIAHSQQSFTLPQLEARYSDGLVTGLGVAYGF